MIRFLLLATLTCQLTEQLRLGFDRSTNIITLFCFNEQDLEINLNANTSVKFFVNRTIPGQHLGERVDLTISESGTRASFTITRQLEGYFSCGTVSPHSVTVTSEMLVPLVVLPTFDGLIPASEIYAVQSTDSEVRIPCSFQPGMLFGCYFGEWFKGSTKIFSITKPNAMTCGNVSPGRQIMNTDETKYLVDEETFELVISSVNAEDDSGEYQCQLRVLNPVTTTGQTAPFRSFPTILFIDADPTITEPPKGVIIGQDPDGEGLMKTATFECTALGRPIPVIKWFYIIVNDDGTLGMPVRLTDDDDKYNIATNDSTEDETGRFQRMSVLTITVTENDGGIIRCQAGDVFEDARLTVLSQPAVNVIITLKGEIVYDVGLKMHIHHPVKLKFVYVVGGRLLGRDRQPDEVFNDTKEIIYRENREQVPSECKKCRVMVSLTAQLPGNEVMEGLAVTSRDVIDFPSTTAEQTIYGLTIGISVSIVVILLIGATCIVTIVAMVCRHQKKQMRMEHEYEQRRARDQVGNIIVDLQNADPDGDAGTLIRTTLEKLETLKTIIRTAADSTNEDGTPQMDLRRINASLDGILSELPVPAYNKSQETAKL